MSLCLGGVRQRTFPRSLHLCPWWCAWRDGGEQLLPVPVVVMVVVCSDNGPHSKVVMQALPVVMMVTVTVSLRVSLSEEKRIEKKILKVS